MLRTRSSDHAQPASAGRVDALVVDRSCGAHGAGLFSRADSILRDRALAEVVVADVIADACVGRDLDDDDRRLRRRLARRTYARCQARDASAATSPLQGSGEPAARVPGSAAGATAALRGLTGHQRAAIALVCFGGHSYRQAVDLLGLPAGSVSGLLRSGLRDARTVMDCG